jgi:catalase
MTEKYATTDAGAPVPSFEHSLTVGPDGPILLQDHYPIEQTANFNRERIPERQPHAKGGAYGSFEVTGDAGSRRSSTPPRATSFARRSACSPPICVTTTCSGISGRCHRNPLTRSPG